MPPLLLYPSHQFRAEWSIGKTCTLFDDFPIVPTSAARGANNDLGLGYSNIEQRLFAATALDIHI
jgi:hypothetical protein